MRFINGLIVATVTYGMITEPLLPFWRARSNNSDDVNLAYYSLIYLHNFHNNPIFVTASDILIKS